MFNIKYQRVLRATLCATVLISAEAVSAPKDLYEEGEYPLIKGGRVNLPNIKRDKVADGHESVNLIGRSNLTFKVNRQKYNLVGVSLFSGKDPVSAGIKVATRSKFSHVGVILSDVNDENRWFSFESTGTKGEVLKGHYPHVRIAPWETVVNNYYGKVSYRLFVFQDGNRTDPDKVTDFVEKYDGKSYTKNPFRLAKALFDKNKESKSKILKTAFCSELTAKMLMDFGMLKEGAASNYLPKDFTSKRNIALASNISLTPEFKKK